MHLVLYMSFYTTTYIGFVTGLMTACHCMIPTTLDQCRLLRKHDLLDICLKVTGYPSLPDVINNLTEKISYVILRV